MRWLNWLLFLATVGLGGWILFQRMTVEPPASYRTTTIKRGDLNATISATGTVEPEDIVDVGAQVNGKISSLGQDPRDKTKRIDFGTQVEEDTVLACIDDLVYKAQMDQAKAALVRATADLEQMKAKAEQAENEWKRADSLRPSKAISDSDYDLALSTFRMAKANVGVGEAEIQQRKAALNLAETNLSYTVIKSPVRGRIIDRRVNVGQTVVASMNAPSLFLIAKDLKRMQVKAAVNEADIGQIREGMPVRFSVDAHPKREYQGAVSQIRLNATTSQNVVTYTVIVSAENADLSLLPYLTANVRFEVDRRSNVWQVPNGALRWKPRQLATASADRSKPAPDKAGTTAEGRTRRKKPDAAKDAKEAERGQIWVKNGDALRPIDVQVGLTDGAMTEVNGPELRDDLEVVLAEIRAADASTGGTTNPFAPPVFRRGGSSGGSSGKGPP